LGSEILHICLLTSGRIFERSVGGEEKYTISLSKWLLEQSVKVTIMGSTYAGIKTKHLSSVNDLEKNETSEDHSNNFRVSYPPYLVYQISRMVLSVRWIIEIMLTNRYCKYSIIHAQDTGFSGLAAVIAGKILGIPVIVSSHGVRHQSIKPLINGKSKKILYNIEFLIDKFTVKFSEKVIAVNSFIKEYYEKLTPKKLDLLPSPIKVIDFEFSSVNRSQIRDELGITDSAIVICYVGRLSPEKNINTLLDAFERASVNNPYLNLVIVGDGILERQLRMQVTASGLENSTFFTGVRNDVNRLISCADIFVLPSFTEGNSTVLLEAMANGRAIICSDIPGNGHIISSEEGLLFDPHDIEDLEKAIIMLSSDNSLRKRLGENAKRKVVQFDENILFARTLKLYKSLLH